MKTWKIKHVKRILISALLWFVLFNEIMAGPPFYTDDPEPVEFHHWEYYLSSLSLFQSYGNKGTLPHVEVNYGIIENTQIHVLIPYNYSKAFPGRMQMGYANTEVGIKFRFVQETSIIPQIGVFPLAEVPTLKNATFGNGKTQLYLPLWFQKSMGKFTTYAGAGYWLNPGTGNKNWIFCGWEGQYDFSKAFTLGAEVFHQTPDNEMDPATTFVNAGGYVNFSDNIHFLFSAGRSLQKTPEVSLYLGVQLTI